ncbi:hypothetical protein AOLI_G00233810 [Acnodon oligacanthus]
MKILLLRTLCLISASYWSTSTAPTASYSTTSAEPPTTASYSRMSTEPTATFYRSTSGKTAHISDERFSSSSVITTVCVCVALLLIGGSALMFKLRCQKTQNSALSSRQSGTSESVYNNYEIDQPGNLDNISMSSVYQNLKPNTIQTDSVYQRVLPQERVGSPRGREVLPPMLVLTKTVDILRLLQRDLFCCA